MKQYLLILLAALIGLNAQAQEEDKATRRIVSEFFQPEYTSRAQGIVIVEVLIDKDGKVLEAHAGSLGTTVKDKSLWASSEAAALKTRFNAVEEAEPQWSTIAYHFGNTCNPEDIATIEVPVQKVEVPEEEVEEPDYIILPATPKKPREAQPKHRIPSTTIQRSFYGMTFGQTINRQVVAQHFNVSEGNISVMSRTDHKVTYLIRNANRTFAMMTWRDVMVEAYDGLFYSIIFKNPYSYMEEDKQENDYNTIRSIFNKKYSSIRDWPGCCDEYGIKKTVWKDKTSVIELVYYSNPQGSYNTLTYKSTSMEENLVENVFNEI